MTSLLLLGWLAGSSAHSAAPAGTFPIVFEDLAQQAGLSFVLNNGRTPEKHQVETMPGGVAVFDYDNDGLPDIYLTNGAEQPSLTKTRAAFQNRLYRNLGNWRFEDVTEKAGVGGRGYNFGVAAGDFDNDGNEDLFVTGVNGNILYRNRGDGRFEDVTKAAGLDGGGWSITAAWLDYDRDGRLDLFVVDYVRWDPDHEPYCGDQPAGLRTFCHPRFYAPLANHLYHNEGNGVFRDVSKQAGIADAKGKGMGIAVGDFDGDGWPDIFVANDTVPNFLFHNNRDGTFSEVALQTGVALNDDGTPVSSMGVEMRDVENTGHEDLVITDLAGERFSYFHNDGHGSFVERTYQSRLGGLSYRLSGWGLGVVDFDNDGWKDIFTANGDVQFNTESYSSGDSRQRSAVFRNDGHGGFDLALVGEAALHRGVAFGDFDGDGRVDAVVSALGGRVELLKNSSPSKNHWVSLRLFGTKSNRDAIGARVTVEAGGMRQTDHVTTSSGYAASSDRVVHFGIGTARVVDRLVIEWPSGIRQTVSNLACDRRYDIREPN